jgi:AsmA protein
MNITFTTADLVALLRPEGGAFSMTAKAADKDLSAQGNLALIPGLVALTNANIKFNDQAINGRVTLTEKAGDQALDAQVELEKNGQQWKISAKTPALQKLMQPEGAAVEVALESGSQAAEVKANFSNVDQVIKLNPLVLTLNGGTGKGYISFDQKATIPMLTVNLDFPTLDLNPLLSFAEQPETGKAVEPAAAAPASKETPLRNLNAQINLKAAQLKAKNLQVSNVDLNASLKDGILNATLADVGLYSGKASLKARVDGNTSEPQFTINTEGNDVNIGSLLMDAMQSNIFAGIGHWKADISGSGTKTPALYSSLKGRGDIELKQGVIRGMDLFQLMSAVRGDFASKASDQTNEVNAKGSFTMAQGVLENNDLVLQSPNIEAAGQGKISLPHWEIDYRFSPKIGERRKAGEGEKFVGQNIPVLIQGSLDHPKIGPDPKALIGTGLEMLKGVKGVNKYLAPLGLGGEAEQPATEGATEVPADGTVPAAEQEAPKKKNKFNPLNSLKDLF